MLDFRIKLAFFPGPLSVASDSSAAPLTELPKYSGAVFQIDGEFLSDRHDGNLLAVLGDGLRIPARFRAGENGTSSAKVGSSKEGDPGKLGSCDDYWQRGFCSLPTRRSFGRAVPRPSKWTRNYLGLRMARPSLRRYCRIQRFCRLSPEGLRAPRAKK